MAYSNDRKLRRRVSNSAKALRISAKWESSRKSINVADDFIYELFTLFCLVIDLKSNYVVRYDPGVGNKQNCFPRKPANKKDRPRFLVYNHNSKNALWQVCSGTKIKDIHGKSRAPDVSLQVGDSSDEPNYHDVLLIWDAKYKHNNETISRISSGEFSVFGRWIELFRLKNGTKPNIKLKTSEEMIANCLITNGRESTEPDDECLRKGLKEVFNYYPDKIYKIRP